MAKVYGIHVVELNEGITPEFFEKFVRETFLPALPLKATPGVKASLLKADRGERMNKYVWLFEFDDVQTRDRYFPQANTASPELLELIRPLREISQVWDRASRRSKTDYVVIAES